MGGDKGMLVGATLVIMLVITLFAIIGGNSFISITDTNVINNSIIVNGTTTSFETSVDTTFGLDPITGGIALIITLSVLGGVIGLRVLGSGLSEASVKIILLAFFYGGLWAILSLLSINLITAIELFGGIIYMFLTLAYAIGVVNKYFGTGGDA